MHIKRNAVITSLLRYALVKTGSTFPPDLVRKVHTQITNVAARTIGGVRRTARLECLHFTMQNMPSMNLYVAHCAAFLDGRIRAHNSSKERLIVELRPYYENESFGISTGNIITPYTEIRERRPKEILQEKWLNSMWSFKTYRRKRTTPKIDGANSTFVCRAGVYNFSDAYEWLDVALKVLIPIGWTPECSEGQLRNIAQALPPKTKPNHLHIGSIVNKTESTTRVESELVN